MWSGYLSRLNFINEQLRSPVAVNIIMNLEDASSTYGQSFHLVKKELTKVCTQLHKFMKVNAQMQLITRKQHMAMICFCCDY